MRISAPATTSGSEFQILTTHVKKYFLSFPLKFLTRNLLIYTPPLLVLAPEITLILVLANYCYKSQDTVANFVLLAIQPNLIIHEYNHSICEYDR